VDLADAMSSLFPGARGAILTVLARTSKPLTSPTIAQLTRGSFSRAGTLRAVNELVEVGIVDAVQAGKAKLFSLNRDHVAAGAIENLASLRSVLFERIRETLATWNISAVSVAVFGSTARGDSQFGSDVDLLVVRSEGIDSEQHDWAKQLMNLTISVQRWSGAPCDIIEYADSQSS
jgi:predicted nucleotidyltransferase